MDINVQAKLNDSDEPSENKFGCYSSSFNNITVETLKDGDASVIYGVEAANVDISTTNSRFIK